MKEITLPSGAVLKIQPAPFAEAKNLHQAVLEELRRIRYEGEHFSFNFFKDAMCSLFSSKIVENCLDKCLRRCLYNDFKIDEKTFEKQETWVDYVDVCHEVGKENIDAFMESLCALLNKYHSKAVKKDPA